MIFFGYSYAYFKRISYNVFIVCTLIASLTCLASARRTASARSLPALQIAPNFSLHDTNHHVHTLAEFNGKPVVIFFFCGCPWCHQCATDWANFQRGKVLPAASPGHGGVTLVVFSAPVAEVCEFAQQTGLDAETTILLPDSDMRVTNIYHAAICPRVFVLDAKGRIQYTNNHTDDIPRQAESTLIVSRALIALRQSKTIAKLHK